MNATIEKLLLYAAGGTAKTDTTHKAKFSEHTAKSADETDKTPLTSRKRSNIDSCVSFVSELSAAYFENTVDPEAILERAAIMEYDGNLPRSAAERMAAAEVDAWRPHGTAHEAATWWKYITSWHPGDPDDLPQPPPNCAGNGAMWSAFWKSMDSQNNNPIGDN